MLQVAEYGDPEREIGIPIRSTRAATMAAPFTLEMCSTTPMWTAERGPAGKVVGWSGKGFDRMGLDSQLKGSFGDCVGSPAYSVMGDRLVDVLAWKWQFERAN